MENEETRELIDAVRRLTEIIQNQPAPAQSSQAAEIIISLVPVLGIIFGSVIIFFFLLWNYRLRREMIRTNQYVQPSIKHLRIFALLIGLLSVFVGLPMMIVFMVIEGTSYVVLGGVIPLFAGLALLVFYGASRRQE